jgi:hypothetical protein
VMYVLLCTVHLMGSGPMSRLSVDEARPLLDVLSRLGHVTIVPASRFEESNVAYVCWMDSHPFPVLVGVLARYPGAFRWVVASSPPRRCLWVEPNPTRGESPFYGIDRRELNPEEVGRVANNLREIGDRCAVARSSSSHSPRT